MHQKGANTPRKDTRRTQHRLDNLTAEITCEKSATSRFFALIGIFSFLRVARVVACISRGVLICLLPPVFVQPSLLSPARVGEEQISFSSSPPFCPKPKPIPKAVGLFDVFMT